MTKKDFELIASALRRLGAGHAWKDTCLAMADALANTNPRFDRARFLAACGVQS